MINSTYSYVEATEFNFPNITIFKQVRNEDNVQVAWRANANDGYVFYDPNAGNTEWNEELFEEVPVNYYYREANIPLRFNFDNFPYVAVPESEVDENYIFGVGDNNHEVM